jgi:hypothetical protein
MTFVHHSKPCAGYVEMGQERQNYSVCAMSASLRPFRVKRLQTILRCSVDVSRGLVLLSGFGIKVLVWGCQGRRIFFLHRFLVAMTIRGKPAFGRGLIAPQPCIR